MSAPHVQRVTWAEARAELSAIRRVVFIGEQGVPERMEWDGLDEAASHVLARLADGTPVGCGRLVVVPGVPGRSGKPGKSGKSGGTGRIGRMAVLKDFRRRGIGSSLLAELLKAAQEQGMIRVVLSAQVQVLDFYAAHGFVAYGPEFTDAGIRHRRMARVPPPGGGRI